MGILKNNKKKIHIEKYNLETGETIEEFNTLSIASRKSNLDKSNIKKCCDGLIKSLGGFGWRYIEI